MIAAPADLLVIGALTVDRFADGSTVPGGSVLHIARAAAPRGIRVATITVAGPEPEAQAGLDELRQLAVAAEVAAAPATASFVHGEAVAGRRLRLEHRGGPLRIAGLQLLGRAPTVLLAPIAGEINVGELQAVTPAPMRAAILQGWLRSLDAGTEVRPLPLGSLGSLLVEALATFDLLIASREDLAAESDAPQAQLAALRQTFGGRPALVVTDGANGVWLDAPPSGVRHLALPRRVGTTSTVGAGDILAAFLTLAVGRGDGLDHAAEAAMRTVAEVLEERRT